ncbi:MAG: hypothetical protein HYU88_08640 [Chloroflexi bacterium]|nr:hypothetical protein [Chloroflexota bacterium]
MATQRTLPLILSLEPPLEDLWDRLPASGRREVIVVYAPLIARAARAVVPNERKEPTP